MKEDYLYESLKPFLSENRRPDGEVFSSVCEAGIVHLANVRQQPQIEAMKACLDKGIWPERFRAQYGTYSAADQSRLLSSTAAVIGAGGLGGMVALLLARTGVGRLIVCDGDVFDESNLNRQFLSTISRMGMNKAEAAAEEIARINPAVILEVHSEMVSEANAHEIIGPAQVVVDCLDTMSARYIVEAAAKEMGVPLVHAAVAGLEGFLMTIFPEDPGMEALYGEEAPSKENSAESFLGVPTVIPATLAALEVNEVIHILLGRSAPARNRMIHLDLSALSVDVNLVA